MMQGVLAVLMVVIAFIGVAAWPFVIIFAVNQLFHSSIEFTVLNWVCMMALLITVRASVSASKD
jgi:hypothetical protein